MPDLLLICGSLRAASVNRMLAAEAGRLHGGEVAWADIRMPLYDGDDEDRDGPPPEAHALAEAVRGARAVLIATPEYNQSFPGGLKNALDWVSRTEGQPFEGTPVAIASATAGRAGGARAQYALRLALTPFRPRLLTAPEVMVAAGKDQFDADGRLVTQSYAKALGALVDALKAEAAR
ncbi:MAG: NADPH-dependent FMN reductase [Hasllibacter sp.]